MAIDAVMMFVPKGQTSPTSAIPGESQLAISSSDPLSKDFKQGCFFNIDTFELGLDLEEPRASNSAKNAYDRDTWFDQNHGWRGAPPPSSTGAHTPMATKPPGQRFSGYTRGTGEPKGFDSQVDPITFTKQIDLASTTLMTSCFSHTQFQSATLIKRRGSGSTASSDGSSNYVYLRIDFSEPLIVSFDWSGDDVVKETVKFVCRKIKVEYVGQTESGVGRAQSQSAELVLNEAADQE